LLSSFDKLRPTSIESSTVQSQVTYRYNSQLSSHLSSI